MKKISLLDKAAVLLVCLIIAIAVLYPQSFFSSDRLLGNKWLDPLAAMVVPLVLAGFAYLKTRRHDFRPGVVDALVLTFAAYLLAQNVTGPGALVSVKYVVLGVGIYYLTTLLTAREAKLRQILLYGIVILTLLTCLYGLVEYALQDNIIFASLISQSVPQPLNGVHRIGSTLAHPVPFGVFLLQVIPFSALLLMTSRRFWKRFLAISSISLAVVALFLSYSKGSWIAGGVMAVGALLLTLRSPSRRAFLSAAVVGAILLAVFGVFWTTAVHEVDYRSSISVDGRKAAWRGAIVGIEQHPFGVGLFQGSTEAKKHMDPFWRAVAGPQVAVDNYYLVLPLEAGILGFFIWIVMMFLIFREGIGVARVRGPSRPWALMALAGIAAICLNAFTVDAFLLWPNYLIFWMTAGLLHGISWGKAAREAGNDVAV